MQLTVDELRRAMLSRTVPIDGNGEQDHTNYEFVVNRCDRCSQTRAYHISDDAAFLWFTDRCTCSKFSSSSPTARYFDELLMELLSLPTTQAKILAIRLGVDTISLGDPP